MLVTVVGCGSSEDDATAPDPTPTAPVTATAAERTPDVEQSTTPPPKTVRMPKLVGENAAIAEDELNRMGFTNIDFGSQDEHDTVVLMKSNWTVTRQSTKAGAKVRTDRLIVLTCTKEF